MSDASGSGDPGAQGACAAGGTGPGDGTGPGPGDGTVTWADLLGEARDRLARGGLGPDADARREARLLVEEASGASPAELALVLGDPVTRGAMARFDSMLTRRLSGEPLQYVVGRWGFRDLDLMVDRRVLIPRPETETVVEVALGELDRMGGRELATTVVDLGTGSGAIALSIAAERVRTTVVATDSSPEALAVATANLAGVGRVAARVRMHRGDWFDAVPAELRGRVQMVVTNPPYVPIGAELPRSVSEWEPRGALLSGPDGLDDIRRIVAEAPAWLEPAGVLVCELSPEQASAVSALAAEHFEEVRVAEDLAGRARALVARGPVSR